MSRATTKQDPTGEQPKHRWQCPAGHVSWERINSHVWCHACARELQSASDDVDPEWSELIDRKNDERRAVSSLVEDEWPDFNQVNPY